MKTIKTEKGTELPILNLKGKDYLQVAHRLVWFRERHPDWSIETDFVFQDASSALVKAIIKDEKGRIIATSHKEESLKDFPLGYREKAETGSIGRALALCGFGTQFEPDFDEGGRVVDSPMPPSDGYASNARDPEPGDGHIPEITSYQIDFGKWNRRPIEQIYKEFGPDEIINYIDYLENEAEKKNKPIDPNGRVGIFIKEATNFLAAMENNFNPRSA